MIQHETYSETLNRYSSRDESFSTTMECGCKSDIMSSTFQDILDAPEASPYTPYTYDITQPVDNPNAFRRRTGGYDVGNPLHYDATTATIKFYVPESLNESNRDFTDELTFERTRFVSDFEPTNDRLDATGTVITTKIEPGDVFHLGAYSGLYEFLGVTKGTDDDFPEKLVFAPLNEASRTVHTWRTREYTVYYKTDFVHKFAPYINPDNEDLTISRIDASQYDDLSGVTSLEDLSETNNTDSVSWTTLRHSLITTGKSLLTSLRDSIQDFRARDPPLTNDGVIRDTVHTTTERETPGSEHATVYQTKQ